MQAVKKHEQVVCTKLRKSLPQGERMSTPALNTYWQNASILCSAATAAGPAVRLTSERKDKLSGEVQRQQVCH